MPKVKCQNVRPKFIDKVRTLCCTCGSRGVIMRMRIAVNRGGRIPFLQSVFEKVRCPTCGGGCTQLFVVLKNGSDMPFVDWVKTPEGAFAYAHYRAGGVWLPWYAIEVDAKIRSAA